MPYDPSYKYQYGMTICHLSSHRPSAQLSIWMKNPKTGIITNMHQIMHELLFRKVKNRLRWGRILKKRWGWEVFGKKWLVGNLKTKPGNN